MVRNSVVRSCMDVETILYVGVLCWPAIADGPKIKLRKSGRGYRSENGFIVDVGCFGTIGMEMTEESRAGSKKTDRIYNKVSVRWCLQSLDVATSLVRLSLKCGEARCARGGLPLSDPTKADPLLNSHCPDIDVIARPATTILSMVSILFL